MNKNKTILELAHYLLLIAILLGGWLLFMNFWKGDLWYIIPSWGLLFIASDQLLHVYLLEERFMWED